MGNLLEALHRLQTVELELGKLRQEEERKTRQIRSLERQIRRVDDQLAEASQERKSRRAEIDGLELDVKTREESINKHREELLRARTNKDYAAILTAINTEKADSAKIEKLALEKMAELERVQSQVEDHSAEKAKLDERLATVRAGLEEYLQSTAEQRQQLVTQREAAADGVPTTALATFTRVAEKHEGEAMAEVVRLHPNREEYACSGCNMTLTLECVYALRTRDEIQLCSACGRILYPGESENGSP